LNEPAVFVYNTFRNHIEADKAVSIMKCPYCGREMPDASPKLPNRTAQSVDHAEPEPEEDSLYDWAVRLVMQHRRASASFLHKDLKLGYARAAWLIDRMEEEGIVAPAEGSRPRKILTDPEAWLKEFSVTRYPHYDEAVTSILQSGRASTTYLMKTLKLGYEKAAPLIDSIETDGLIGPFEGPKARVILVDRKAFLGLAYPKAARTRA
jgi:DNA segregation ATPase FtsK/SpoIIIE-like protein